MPLLFAGIAALSYGVADFLGGIAAKRWRPELVAAVAQAAGVPIVLPLLVIFPGEVTGDVVGWGLAAGVAAGAGIALLYRALAAGPMHVAAPTAAVAGAMLPVIVGLALGERPAPLALLGVACGIGAVTVVGVAAPHPTGPVRPGAAVRTALVSIGAGAGLGGAAIAYGQTPADSGLWPLAVGRLVATVLLLAVSIRWVGGSRPRAEFRVPAITGVVDSLGSVFLVLALQRGLLSLVPVISSMYPAVTVLLARVALHERMSRAQAAGLGLAAVAVALIASS